MTGAAFDAVVGVDIDVVNVVVGVVFGGLLVFIRFSNTDGTNYKIRKGEKKPAQILVYSVCSSERSVHKN